MSSYRWNREGEQESQKSVSACIQAQPAKAINVGNKGCTWVRVRRLNESRVTALLASRSLRTLLINTLSPTLFAVLTLPAVLTEARAALLASRSFVVMLTATLSTAIFAIIAPPAVLAEARAAALSAFLSSVTMLTNTLPTALLADITVFAVLADSRARALLAVVGPPAMLADACLALARHLHMAGRKGRATVLEAPFEPTIRVQKRWGSAWRTPPRTLRRTGHN